MKKIQFLLISLLFIASTVSYLIYNDKAYHLGVDCLFCKKSLPFNLKPNFDDRAISDYQFHISDVDDYPVIGAGFRFRDSNIKIKRIIGYGYNDKYLIVKIIDKNNIETFFITDSEQNVDSDINFIELDSNDIDKYNVNLRWTSIEAQEIYKVRFIRNILFLFLIIQIFFIYRKLSPRSAKNKQP